MPVNSWFIGISAEAFSAAQFARLGYKVSVQYGANQPEYDLIAENGDKLLKISVKGSQDGSWGLTQGFLKNADYHQAIDNWLNAHGNKTIFCFVQFKGVATNELPRMYLAHPSEIADVLKSSAKGRGDTILWENHTWRSKSAGAGTTDKIPDDWKFTKQRAEDLFIKYG